MSDLDQSSPDPPTPKEATGSTPDDSLSGQPVQPQGGVPQGASVPPQGPTDDEPSSRRQLELVKGGHRYVFRYQQGDESKLIEDLSAMGHDPNCPLSMFDVAVLSHRLGRRMGDRLEKLLKS